MKRPPAFQVYARDEITDYPGLSSAARGVFLILRCRCWLRGSIPIDFDELARLALCTRREFKRVWPEIRSFFQKRRSSYVFVPLKEQRARQLANRHAKSTNGQLGAMVRWGPRPVERYNTRVIYTVVDQEYFKFVEANRTAPARDKLTFFASKALQHFKIPHTSKLLDEAIEAVCHTWQKRQGQS